MVFLGIGAIIAGVILISTTQRGQSQNIKKGLAAAVVSGLIWGSQLAPLKFGNVAVEDFFFSTTVGIFATALVIFFAAKASFENKAIGLSFLSGVIWNVGNLLSVIAIFFIGIAKAMPFTQASALVAVLWGLFCFKEIPEAKIRLKVLIGAVIMFAGMVVLAMA